jgi:hypothetical protein
MESFSIPAKHPLRLHTQALGLADLSLEVCPRAYSKDLLASFPDCSRILKELASCKPLLLVAVYKTSISMASFSPDTGACVQFTSPLFPTHPQSEAERESIFKRHLELYAQNSNPVPIFKSHMHQVGFAIWRQTSSSKQVEYKHL